MPIAIEAWNLEIGKPMEAVRFEWILWALIY